jgi:hypothetical protein
MGGSIHIHGTHSSIVDSVFVCRLTGRTKRSFLFENDEELREIVERDLERLREAGVSPTMGDIRCVTYGHLTRMTVWRLRQTWDWRHPTPERLERFAREMTTLADISATVRALGANAPHRRFGLAEEGHAFERDADADAVSF